MKTLLLVLLLSLVACESAPMTAAEKKQAAKAIADTTAAVAAATPFPWDAVVYASSGIVAALLGVGGYKKITKPKTPKSPPPP